MPSPSPLRAACAIVSMLLSVPAAAQNGSSDPGLPRAMFAADFGNLSFPASGRVVDFVNGDLFSDLLTQAADGRVTIGLNRALMPLSPTRAIFDVVASPFDAGSAWNVVGVGDFNADGRPDVVWQSPDGIVVAWLSNGAGPASHVYLFRGTSAWRVAAVADMDRNGTSDLIWQSPAGQVVVWLMQRTTIAQMREVWASPSDWRIVGATDFNGDHDSDLLWQHPSGQLVVWTMHGTSRAGAQFLYDAPTAWRVVSAGDLVGNGAAALLWRGPTGQMVAWFLGGPQVEARYVRATATGWQLSPR